MRCEACARETEPASPSCSHCGAAATPRATRTGERRQVTALFCDLVGSVPLTLKLDPEDLSEAMVAYLGACARVIAAHGGGVEQYMGDGVLAFFGYPEADEDDAANAVRAALELRGAIAALDLPVAGPMRVRVGVATGTVVISELTGRGVARRTGIVGEPPNLAASLQAMAEPGGVLVSAATERITRGAFDYRARAPREITGYEAPVESFEALSARTGTGRLQAGRHGRETPLVGRERELGEILRHWAASRAGAGRVVLLRGEPGIGKSRLVEELRRQAADTLPAKMVWYCSPSRRESAFFPIVQQLARAAGFRPADDEGARREKFSRLLEGHGDIDTRSREIVADLLGVPGLSDASITRLSPDKRRELTIGIVLAVMQRVAGDGPALFVVEDAQWADSATLAVLDGAFALTPGRPWLILIASRPEFAPAWAADRKVACLSPARLTRPEAERLCEQIAQGSLPPSAVHDIVSRCDGIPLHVEEMTRSVLEGVGTAGPVVPISIRDSLMARLDRLGPARPLANLGAAIGRRFSHDILAAVADLPEARLREGLDQLLRSGLVERTEGASGGAYRFAHGLIREAAYASLLRRERESLHGRIAAVLRDRFPLIQDAEPELAAYHFTLSGAAQEAVPLWSAAARRAAARGAHHEAVAHFRTALDLLRQRPESDVRLFMELQLLVFMGISLGASSALGSPAMMTALAEARAICDRLGNLAGLVTVFSGLGVIYMMTGELDAARDMAERCLAVSEQTGLPAHRIEAYRNLGALQVVGGEFRDGRASLELAIRIFEDHPEAVGSYPWHDHPVLAASAWLHHALFALGDDDGANLYRDKCLSLARSGADGVERSRAIVQVAYACIVRQDFPFALRLAEEAITLADDLGYGIWSRQAQLARAFAVGGLGDPKAGLERALDLHAELARRGESFFHAHSLALIARLTAMTGDATSGLTLIDKAMAEVHRRKSWQGLPLMHIYRAEILRRLGEVDTAVAELNTAIAIAGGQGAEGFSRRAEAMLADLARAAALVEGSREGAAN